MDSHLYGRVAHPDLAKTYLPVSILQLDEADRAVLRVADIRDSTQKKTFTKWVNNQLIKKACKIRDLFNDLRSGTALITLLEILSRQSLPRARGCMRFHHLQNVETALNFLKTRRGLRLVNIRPEDIVDGNPKLTLGLLWVIILHYQLSEVFPDEALGASAAATSDVALRDYLLDWCSKSLSDYPDLRLENFSASWADGRAFLYLIHRFRPNLIDPKRIPAMSAEERLRLAFELNEQHLGVSNLLDPEDVNMPEPDERSLITYVSSIYDVVAEHRSPQQPQRQPVSDSSWEEYRRSAMDLLNWLRHSATAADSVGRDIASGSLSQLKSTAERFEAQRKAEAEQRLAQKTALICRYDELLGSSGGGAGIRVEPELRPEQLERAWERYNLAVKERGRALQQRITKLERMHMLADGVRTVASEAEAQLRAVSVQLLSLAPDAHPKDAENSLRNMTNGLAEVGQRVDTLFYQVQELREEQYAQAEHLYHRLCSLHLSYLDMNRQVESVMAKRASRSGSSTSQQFRRHAEQLLQQGSSSSTVVGSGFYDDVANVSQAFSSLPAYSELRRCMAWIRQREDQLRRSQQPPAGADVVAVRDIAELLRRLSASVIQQRSQIDACESARGTLAPGDERQTFDRLFAELDSAYKALLQAANRRLAETEELLAFMESAEAEVAWLVEKESEVLGHDWGTAGLDTDDVEIYFKKLMESLEGREDKFNAVINQGAEMRRRGHPAEATVHETTSRMEQQWTWFLSLTNCLEHHLEMAVRSGQFFAIARELNDWAEQAQRQLSSEFLLYEDQSTEEGQELLRSLRSARDQLLQKSVELENLNGEAAQLAPVPLKRNQRYLPLTGITGARTLCGYQHLAQGEPLELLDSSGPKCLARPREGSPVWLPALCIRLSGPCPEACDAAKKLGVKFQHLEKLLQHRELRLREQLVRASMASLLQQTPDELAALSLEHRRAVLDSLNQDAGKLLLDMKVAGMDPLDSQKFHADLDACNDAFFRLARGAGRFADSGQLQEQLEQLDTKLANFETRMRALTSAGGPDNLASLEAAVTEQDSLESKLSGLEWEMNFLRQRLQQELGCLPDSFQLLERRRASVWDVAHEQVRRLQVARDFLAQLEELASSLNHAERLLKESRVFPVREAEMQRHLSSLRNVQQILEAAKSDLSQAESAQQLSKLARPTGERWRRLSETVEQRLALLDHCAGQFEVYMRLAKQFSLWLVGCHRRLQSAGPNDAQAIVDVGRSAEEAAGDLSNLNAAGSELIEVARTYDFASRASTSGSEGGAEQLQEELARLNSEFQKLVASLEQRQQATSQPSYAQAFGDGFPQPSSISPVHPKPPNHALAPSSEAIKAEATEDELMQLQQQSQQEISPIRTARAGVDSLAQSAALTPQNKFGKRQLGGQRGQDVSMTEEEIKLHELDALEALAHELAMDSSQEDLNRPNDRDNFTDPRNSAFQGDFSRQGDGQHDLIRCSHQVEPSHRQGSANQIYQNPAADSALRVDPNQDEPSSKIANQSEPNDQNSLINETDKSLNNETSKHSQTARLLRSQWSSSTRPSALQLATEGAFNPNLLCCYRPDTLEPVSLARALREDFLSGQGVKLEVTPASESNQKTAEVSLDQALELGMLSRNELDEDRLTESLANGSLRVVRAPYAGCLYLRRLVEDNWDSERLQFRDQHGHQATFPEAVETGILHPDLVLVRDLSAGESVTLAAALDRELVNPVTGAVLDTNTGCSAPLEEAARIGIITGPHERQLARSADARPSKQTSSFPPSNQCFNNRSQPESSADFLGGGVQPKPEPNSVGHSRLAAESVTAETNNTEIEEPSFEEAATEEVVNCSQSARVHAVPVVDCRQDRHLDNGGIEDGDSLQPGREFEDEVVDISASSDASSVCFEDVIHGRQVELDVSMLVELEEEVVEVCTSGESYAEPVQATSHRVQEAPRHLAAAVTYPIVSQAKIVERLVFECADNVDPVREYRSTRSLSETEPVANIDRSESILKSSLVKHQMSPSRSLVKEEQPYATENLQDESTNLEIARDRPGESLTLPDKLGNQYSQAGKRKLPESLEFELLEGDDKNYRAKRSLSQTEMVVNTERSESVLAPQNATRHAIFSDDHSSSDETSVEPVRGIQEERFADECKDAEMEIKPFKTDESETSRNTLVKNLADIVKIVDTEFQVLAVQLRQGLKEDLRGQEGKNQESIEVTLGADQSESSHSGEESLIDVDQQTQHQMQSNQLSSKAEPESKAIISYDQEPENADKIPSTADGNFNTITSEMREDLPCKSVGLRDSAARSEASSLPRDLVNDEVLHHRTSLEEKDDKAFADTPSRDSANDEDLSSTFEDEEGVVGMSSETAMTKASDIVSFGDVYPEESLIEANSEQKAFASHIQDPSTESKSTDKDEKANSLNTVNQLEEAGVEETQIQASAAEFDQKQPENSSQDSMRTSIVELQQKPFELADIDSFSTAELQKESKPRSNLKSADNFDQEYLPEDRPEVKQDITSSKNLEREIFQTIVETETSVLAVQLRIADQLQEPCDDSMSVSDSEEVAEFISVVVTNPIEHFQQRPVEKLQPRDEVQTALDDSIRQQISSESNPAASFVESEAEPIKSPDDVKLQDAVCRDSESADEYPQQKQSSASTEATSRTETQNENDCVTNQSDKEIASVGDEIIVQSGTERDEKNCPSRYPGQETGSFTFEKPLEEILTTEEAIYQPVDKLPVVGKELVQQSSLADAYDPQKDLHQSRFTNSKTPDQELRSTASQFYASFPDEDKVRSGSDIKSRLESVVDIETKVLAVQLRTDQGKSESLSGASSNSSEAYAHDFEAPQETSKLNETEENDSRRREVTSSEFPLSEEATGFQFDLELKPEEDNDVKRLSDEVAKTMINEGSNDVDAKKELISDQDSIIDRLSETESVSISAQDSMESMLDIQSVGIDQSGNDDMALEESPEEFLEEELNQAIVSFDSDSNSTTSEPSTEAKVLKNQENKPKGLLEESIEKLSVGGASGDVENKQQIVHIVDSETHLLAVKLIESADADEWDSDSESSPSGATVILNSKVQDAPYQRSITGSKDGSFESETSHPEFSVPTISQGQSPINQLATESVLPDLEEASDKIEPLSEQEEILEGPIGPRLGLKASKDAKRDEEFDRERAVTIGKKFNVSDELGSTDEVQKDSHQELSRGSKLDEIQPESLKSDVPPNTDLQSLSYIPQQKEEFDTISISLELDDTEDLEGDELQHSESRDPLTQPVSESEIISISIELNEPDDLEENNVFDILTAHYESNHPGTNEWMRQRKDQGSNEDPEESQNKLRIQEQKWREDSESRDTATAPSEENPETSEQIKCGQGDIESLSISLEPPFEDEDSNEDSLIDAFRRPGQNTSPDMESFHCSKEKSESLSQKEGSGNEHETESVHQNYSEQTIDTETMVLAVSLQVPNRDVGAVKTAGDPNRNDFDSSVCEEFEFGKAEEQTDLEHETLEIALQLDDEINNLSSNEASQAVVNTPIVQGDAEGSETVKSQNSDIAAADEILPLISQPANTSAVNSNEDPSTQADLQRYQDGHQPFLHQSESDFEVLGEDDSEPVTQIGSGASNKENAVQNSINKLNEIQVTSIIDLETMVLAVQLRTGDEDLKLPESAVSDDIQLEKSTELGLESAIEVDQSFESPVDSALDNATVEMEQSLHIDSRFEGGSSPSQASSVIPLSEQQNSVSEANHNLPSLQIGDKKETGKSSIDLAPVEASPYENPLQNEVWIKDSANANQKQPSLPKRVVESETRVLAVHLRRDSDILIAGMAPKPEVAELQEDYKNDVCESATPAQEPTTQQAVSIAQMESTLSDPLQIATEPELLATGPAQPVAIASPQSNAGSSSGRDGKSSMKNLEISSDDGTVQTSGDTEKEESIGDFTPSSDDLSLSFPLPKRSANLPQQRRSHVEQAQSSPQVDDDSLMSLGSMSMDFVYTSEYPEPEFDSRAGFLTTKSPVLDDRISYDESSLASPCREDTLVVVDGKPLTFKEAIELGAIDPHGITLSLDSPVGRRITLQEAIDDQLVDPSTGVLHLPHGPAYPLSMAAQLGFMQGIDPSDLIATRGSFENQSSKEHLPQLLAEEASSARTSVAVDEPLSIDVECSNQFQQSTMPSLTDRVSSSSPSQIPHTTSTICHDPLPLAVASSISGSLGSTDSDGKKLAPLTVDEDTAIDAKKMADDLLKDLEKELNSLNGIEEWLLTQGPANLDEQNVMKLLEGHQDINNELLARQSPLLTLYYQTENLVQKCPENLTSNQKELLSGQTAASRSKLEQLRREADARIRQLTSVQDALEHFNDRLQTAQAWQEGVDRRLIEIAKASLPSGQATNIAAVLTDPTQLQSLINDLKACEGELSAHQGDLKALSSAGHKLIHCLRAADQTQEAFASARHREFTGAAASCEAEIRKVAGAASERQESLAVRCRDLLQRLNTAASQRREFSDLLHQTEAQLKATESQLAKLEGQQPTSDIQLNALADKAQGLSADLFALDGSIEKLRAASAALTAAASVAKNEPGTLSEQQRQTEETAARHDELKRRCAELSGRLQQQALAAGSLLDTLNGLQQWLEATNRKLSAMRPVSLRPDVLDEQSRQAKVLDADLQCRRTSLNQASESLAAMSESDPTHRQADAKLRVCSELFENVRGQIDTRRADIEEVRAKVAAFRDSTGSARVWIEKQLDSLASREFAKLDDERLEERLREMDQGRDEFETGQLAEVKSLKASLQLLQQCSDQNYPAEVCQELDRFWQELNNALEARRKDLLSRQAHGHDYNRVKKEAQDWLVRAEGRLRLMDSVCLEEAGLSKQEAETRQLAKERDEFQASMERFVDLGHAYDALVQGASTASTPDLAKSSPRRPRAIRQPQLRSPLSPLSSSESSGVCSVDPTAYLQELSDIAQELEDFQTRFAVLGERLADRIANIEDTRDRLERFRAAHAEASRQLDDLSAESAALLKASPGSEADATEQLRAVAEFHRSLEGLEPRLDAVRNQAEALLKNRDLAAGAAELRDSIKQLERRLSDLKDLSLSRQASLRTLGQQLEEFSRDERALSKWLGQKAKLVSVLGPLVTTPGLAASQLQQVGVLQEELESKLPAVEQLRSVCNSLLQRLPEYSTAASDVRAAMAAAEAGVDDLRRRLDEREAALNELSGPTAEFYALVNDLSDRLAQAESPEDHDLSTEEVTALIPGLRADLDRAGELCKLLCDAAGDPSVQFDLKNKLSSLERRLRDLRNKLDEAEQRKLQAGQGEAMATQRAARVKQWADEALRKLEAEKLSKPDETLISAQSKAAAKLAGELHWHEAELRDLASTQTSPDSPLQQGVQAAQDSLAALEAALDERRGQLADLSDLVTKCSDRSKRLKAWLQLEEMKLGAKEAVELTDITDEQTASRHAMETRQLLAELDRKQLDIDELAGLVADLTSAAEAASTSEPAAQRAEAADLAGRVADDRIRATELAEKLESLAARLRSQQQQQQKQQESEETAAAAAPLSSSTESAATSGAMEGANTAAIPEELRARAAELTKELDSAEARLDGLPAASLDADTVRDQLDDAKAAGNRLADLASELDALANATASAGGPAGEKIAQRLERMAERAKRAGRRAGERQQELRQRLDDLDALETQLAEVTAGVEAAKDDLVNIPDSQLGEFRRGKMAGLERDADAASAEGRALLRSAPPSLPAARLTGEIEAAQAAVRQLQAELERRSREADAKAAGSGRVDDAISAWREWLDEAEAAQRAVDEPSCDAERVSQQLENQAAFLASLAEREPLLFELARSAAMDPGSAAEATDLKRRFDALKSAALDRREKLRRAQEAAAEFRARLNPLLAAMDACKKRVAALGGGSTDPESTSKQIEEHKAIVGSLAELQPQLRKADLSGRQLADLVGPHDNRAVMQELSDAEQQLEGLRAAVQDKMEALFQAAEDLKNFIELSNSLSEWLCLADSQLETAYLHMQSVQDDRATVANLRELAAELLQRQQDIDQLLQDAEALAQSTGSGPEESLALQQRVAAVAEYYQQLRQKADAKLDLLEAALGPAEQLTTAHAQLDSALIPLEADLRSRRAPASGRLERLTPLAEAVQQQGDELAKILGRVGGAAEIEDEGDGASRQAELVEQLVERDMNRVRYATQGAGLVAPTSILGDSLGDTDPKNEASIANSLERLEDWMRARERALASEAPPTIDPAGLRRQEAALAALEAEHRQAAVDKLGPALQNGRELLLARPPQPAASRLTDAMEAARKADADLTRLIGERRRKLEEVKPLGEELLNAAEQLEAWLSAKEDEVRGFAPARLNADQLRSLQGDAKRLQEEVDDKKALVDRVKKTAPALCTLLSPADAATTQAQARDLDRRYADLRRRVRDRLAELDNLLAQTADITEKLDAVAENLAITGELVRAPEPVSANPAKLREQLQENAALEQELQNRLEALTAVRAAADELLKATGDRQPTEEVRKDASDVVQEKCNKAVADIRDRVDQLMREWQELKDSVEQRGQWLGETLPVSEAFWDETARLSEQLENIGAVLRANQDLAASPDCLRDQKATNAELQQGLNDAMGELVGVQDTADKLESRIGPSEVPDVRNAVDDLKKTSDGLAKDLQERQRELDSQYAAACEFQDALQSCLDLMEQQEAELANLATVPESAAGVKDQSLKLADFREGLGPLREAVERANQLGMDVAQKASPDDRKTVESALDAANNRWDTFMDGLNDSEHRLASCLLNLGEFQHALDHLLDWIAKTRNSLDAIRVPIGEPRLIELELAKHKLIIKDVARYEPMQESVLEQTINLDMAAHGDSVAKVEESGQQLLRSKDANASAGDTREKLRDLKDRWDELLSAARDKQLSLEKALRESRAYHADSQELAQDLANLDAQLAASEPIGGLPDSAKQQLAKFDELLAGFPALRRRISDAHEAGEALAAQADGPGGMRLRSDLSALDKRWAAIEKRAEERRKQLEEAANTVTSFHADLTRMINWLTGMERELAGLQPVSRVVTTVEAQIDAHTRLKAALKRQREPQNRLESSGTHLKYFSRKQDVVIIKNLLASVQHRWDRLVSRAAERTRQLDVGHREASKFLTMWRDLTAWIRAQSAALDADQAVSSEPQALNEQLARHTEFQAALAAKNPQLDSARRYGQQLKERAPDFDQAELTTMINDLKQQWKELCERALKRERKLGDALTYSGRYLEAMQTLIDWLNRAEPALSPEALVGGDLDTVLGLSEHHRQFEKELDRKRDTLDLIQRSAAQLLSNSVADANASRVQEQLVDLETQWDRVTRLSAGRRQQLDEAAANAEAFASKARGLLALFTQAEQRIEALGTPPDPETEAAYQERIDEHAKFHEELSAKRPQLDEALAVGSAIHDSAHPDGRPRVRQWLLVLQSRWDQVFEWSIQRGEKLKEAKQAATNRRHLLQELLEWLASADASLRASEAKPLPTSIPEVELLIDQQKAFEAEIEARQPDLDSVTAHAKRSLPESAPAAKKPRRSGGGGSSSSVGDYHHYHQLHHQLQDQQKQQQPGSPGFKDPAVNRLQAGWKQLWLDVIQRRQKLEAALLQAREIEAQHAERRAREAQMKRLEAFDFDEWRQRYKEWMDVNKFRVMDFFKKKDTDHDGKVTRQEFINGVLESNFPTSQLEMEKVADQFDLNGDGFIDYKEFESALRPGWRQRQPATESERIHEQVRKLASDCTCCRPFQIKKIGEGKYVFGENQKLRLVRILRSTVMVRIGGGWQALDEFLVKNDPCRGDFATENIYDIELYCKQQGIPLPESLATSCSSLFDDDDIVRGVSGAWKLAAKGRTNIELREKFILADGVAQSVQAFSSRPPTQTPPASSSPGATPSPTSHGATGPVTKIREKSVNERPWRQQPARRSVRGAPAGGGGGGGRRPSSRAGSEVGTSEASGGHLEVPASESASRSRHSSSSSRSHQPGWH